MCEPALSLEHAAKILDVCVDTVKRMIKKGELKAFKLGRNTRVYQESITNYQISHEINHEKIEKVSNDNPRRKSVKTAKLLQDLKNKNLI